MRHVELDFSVLVWDIERVCANGSRSMFERIEEVVRWVLIINIDEVRAAIHNMNV